MSCESCNRIVHAECAKFNFEFNHISNCWQCNECVLNSGQKYNPFATISHDKHDPVNLDEIEDLAEISKILDDCCYYNTTKLKNFFKSKINNNMTVLFNNIDGNATNFDNFVAEISRHDHQFSIMGIAETNIDECFKDLYKVPGFVSEYNNKIPNKAKGSGIALYIKESFNYNRDDALCQTTTNL